MRGRVASRWITASTTFLLFVTSLQAKEKTPISDTALDGGVLSAETLGRGNTIASNRATPASGSENPAALADSPVNAVYTSVLVDTRSKLTPKQEQANDPLQGRVLQYLSIQGEKGVIYYEPLSRQNTTEVTNEASPTTDFRDVEYSADAIGFAGAERFGAGSIGLSIAYLHSSIGVEEHRSGAPDKFTSDTADGFRFNLGVRYPTGPAMWGILVQNAPAFLWGKDYSRELLPVRVRFGNTVRLAPGFLLSADWERRYYHEGSNKDDYFYLGDETAIGKYAVFRIGMYGTNLSNPRERHTTGGLSFIARSGAQLTYGLDISKEYDEDVKKSYLSFQFPFESVDDSSSSR